MNRRSFLAGMAGILAAGPAPAVIQAGSIMRVRPITLRGDSEFEAVGALLERSNELLRGMQWVAPLGADLRSVFYRKFTHHSALPEGLWRQLNSTTWTE